MCTYLNVFTLLINILFNVYVFKCIYHIFREKEKTCYLNKSENKDFRESR